MSTESISKINSLLSSQPKGIVFASSWLREQGYSLDLQKRYKKSRWLQTIGTGAMMRTGDKINYQGGVYALQKQLQMSVHPGGKTALALLGRSHYLDLGETQTILFGKASERLPKWFIKAEWASSILYNASDFLPASTGLSELEIKDFSIMISSPARAILECIYLAPDKQSLSECYELMEGLNNLRPAIVQELLEQCTSVKVKRLFMYFSEKAGHSWLQYLNKEKIDFGKGKRSIVKNGVYIPKYLITVPKEFEKNGSPSL